MKMNYLPARCEAITGLRCKIPSLQAIGIRIQYILVFPFARTELKQKNVKRQKKQTAKVKTQKSQHASHRLMEVYLDPRAVIVLVSIQTKRPYV